MSSSGFIGYVGLPDFHDGTVLRVSRQNEHTSVWVRGYSGTEYEIRFEGVQAVEMFQPEGMELYAISEMRTDPPLRRFDFANNGEEGRKSLAIIARGFQVSVGSRSR